MQLALAEFALILERKPQATAFLLIRKLPRVRSALDDSTDIYVLPDAIGVAVCVIVGVMCFNSVHMTH